ncbi:MAG: hypothetical protein FWD90_11055 [Defluviitaleaceae bacterium]|nr:hypothetical protein [Defluviitaleaceae bacterium]
MGDVFKEQIIKRKPTARDFVFRVLLVAAAGLIFFLAMMFLPSFGVIFGFAAMFGAWYGMSFLNVEYEYVFTNGDLDIDVIYNKARRKRLFTGQVNNFEIMCHVDDKVHIGDFASAQETRDYSSGESGENTYVFLTTQSGKRIKVIFEPNEKLLKAIGTVLTRRKLFIKQ